MEKPDDIIAPSAQGRQIPQYNVLHSTLRMRLEEALSSASDCTEETALQIECQTIFLITAKCCCCSLQYTYS